MRLSARNQLLARVTDIDAGRVNGTVRLELTCGGGISANISMKAIEWMQLVPDKTVYAVIKATEVMIAAEPVKISARNRIAGTIADISNGAVNGMSFWTSGRGSRFLPRFRWSRFASWICTSEWKFLLSLRLLLL